MCVHNYVYMYIVEYVVVLCVCHSCSEGTELFHCCTVSCFPLSSLLSPLVFLSPLPSLTLSFPLLLFFLLPTFLLPPLSSPPIPSPSLPSPPLLPPGQLAATEDTDGGGEDIPTSLEVGLLGHVRKVLMLLPDSLVLRVVGHVIQHNCLIAMAYNNDIIVRTAVIRVSAQVLSLFFHVHFECDHWSCVECG